MALTHKHFTDPAGLCPWCFGEGFRRATNLAQEMFDRLATSTASLKAEMDKAEEHVSTSLTNLKEEPEYNLSGVPGAEV